MFLGQFFKEKAQKTRKNLSSCKRLFAVAVTAIALPFGCAANHAKTAPEPQPQPDPSGRFLVPLPMDIVDSHKKIPVARLWPTQHLALQEILKNFDLLELDATESPPSSPLTEWTSDDDLFKKPTDRWIQLLKKHYESLQNPAKRKTILTFMGKFNHLKDLDLETQLDEIDTIVDSYLTYKSDQEQYRRTDAWATPYATIISKQGDCEDYAILKFFILKYLNGDQNKYNFLIIDQPSTLSHALLIVDVSTPPEKPRFTILDNIHENFRNTIYVSGYNLRFLANENDMILIP